MVNGMAVDVGMVLVVLQNSKIGLIPISQVEAQQQNKKLVGPGLAQGAPVNSSQDSVIFNSTILAYIFQFNLITVLQ